MLLEKYHHLLLMEMILIFWILKLFLKNQGDVAQQGLK